MKKMYLIIMLLIVALLATPLKASVVFNESFNREVGQLSAGSIQEDMGEDRDNWYYTTNTATKISVVDTALTYAGYQTEKAGKAIRLVGNMNKDVRQFNKVNSSSVYYSALINMKQVKNSNTKDYFLCLLEGAITPAKNYARLMLLSNANRDGYTVGVAKCNEPFYRMSDINLDVDKTYLFVVRYDFVAGDNNDVVSMWINPTKTSEGTPTLVCVQDTANATGDAKGANTKPDASYLNIFYLRPSTSTPANVCIDEIRVATKWADLFEKSGGDTEPAIGVNAKIDFGYVFQGESQTKTLNITASNLTDGITLSKTNADIALSQTKLTKEAAESGAQITVTLSANTTGTLTDTIVLTSGSLVEKVPVDWIVLPVQNCATVSALKVAAANAEVNTYFRLTGVATVTRDTAISGLQEFYIQDADAAVKITDAYNVWKTINVGDNIKNFVMMSDEAAFGIQPFVAQLAPVVVSSGNEAVPQVITLAQLQASPLDYLLELVTVKKVNIDTVGHSAFAAGSYAISQNGTDATLKVEMSIGLTGVAIPPMANVTGFSFSQTGQVIMPRGADDIEDANPVLMANPSFEQYTTSSLFSTQATSFDGWSFSLAGAEPEHVDVIDGKTAFKTTSQFTKTFKLYQSIEKVSYYNTGDEFRMRICYKILNTQGEDLKLDCYWAATYQPRIDADADVLTQTLPYSAEWDTLEVVTHKPAGATKFEFNLQVTGSSIVLLDNFAFDYVNPDTAYFKVQPEKYRYEVNTTLGNAKEVVTLTIKQNKLTQPVRLEFGGSAKSISAFSLDKTQVTKAEEQVAVTYNPAAAGKDTVALYITDDESQATSLQNVMMMIYGTCIDPANKPEITITPKTLSDFACKAKEQVSETINVNSVNCLTYVNVKIESIIGDNAFLIDGSMLSPNTAVQTVVTFRPLAAGTYKSQVSWWTEGSDTVRLVVTGTAAEADPVVIDYATDFVWNSTNPYLRLDEGFTNAADYHNKTLKVNDWQNVVPVGERPWWGFDTDTTTCAKACGYIFGASATGTAGEMWLVTPALDYKNAANKMFSFKVMGELMYEGMKAKLEVYYIDATDPADPFFQKIDAIDAAIPAGDNELNGIWYPIDLNLEGQTNIADAFYMAFKFSDMVGSNGSIYYVSDVVWNKEITAIEDIDVDSVQAEKVIIAGQLYIIKNGQVYTLEGQRVK